MIDLECDADDRVAAIETRLTKVLGDARMPAGTIVSHALGQVLREEIRHQGRDAAVVAWTMLDDEEIAALAQAIVRFFSRESSANYSLPAGTVMMECVTGCAFIDGKIFGFDVDRPGMLPEDDLPTRVGGSNFALLQLIDELSRDQPWRAVGAPTLVTRYHQLHPDDRLQFSPSGTAAGAVLICDQNYTSWGEYFCAFSPDWVRECAEGIVGEMRSFWTRREQIAPRVREAKRAAVDIASQHHELRFHAVTIDPKDWGHGVNDRMAVEFATWDDAFRPGIAAYDIPGKVPVRRALGTDPLDRAFKAAAVHALGADGWIGGLARTAASAAEAQGTHPLHDLATAHETFATIDTPSGPVDLRFHWCAGEIRVSTRFERKLEISDGDIVTLGQVLPETILDSMPGRPLHAVFDQPFRCDAEITSVRNFFRGVAVTLRPDLWLVDCSTGRAIPPPSDETILDDQAERRWHSGRNDHGRSPDPLRSI